MLGSLRLFPRLVIVAGLALWCPHPISFREGGYLPIAGLVPHLDSPDILVMFVLGQQRTSNELRKKGVFISGSGVRCVWLRNNLENFKKRLKALEDKVAKDGIILSDAQVAALEKKKQEKE